MNNTTNPKRIPLAVVRYDVTVTNSGPGTVDAGTLVITDPIPADAVDVRVDHVGQSGGVRRMARPASGLTYNYAHTCQLFVGGRERPLDLHARCPMPMASMPLVRAVRISPGGVMSAAGGGNPSFTIQFRVRIN